MPHDSDGSPDTLHAQLAARVKELADSARANGGHVPADALANAQRLAQLAHLQRELAPPRRAGRWAGAALFAATLFVISFLLVTSVRDTEVELDLVVSELRFKVDSRQQLTDMQQLASLGASGLSRVAVPGVDAVGGAAVPGVRLLAKARGAAAGTISLAPIVAPARAEVTLRTGDVLGELRLSVNGLDNAVRADVSGTIGVTWPRHAPQTLDAATPQPIVLTPGSADVDLDLAPLNGVATLFVPGLTITELSLMRIDEVSQGGKTAVRSVSTLQSGRVFLEELGGRELRLRAHEGLRFVEARGEIRSIGLSDGWLAVNFHGRARGMASGSLEHPRNLMPRWLEWLRANQPLSLLWGAAVYLFGISTAVWQWWKKND